MQLNGETEMPLHKADGTTLCVHKERAVGGLYKVDLFIRNSPEIQLLEE